jgi:uncharacterized membrane protein
MDSVSLNFMAGFYILAGAMHFYQPKFYLRIMPPYIPFHLALVYISGAIEIIFGIFLLVPVFTSFAALGIIALLIAVFPVNVYHLTSTKRGRGIARWVLYLRLPLQGVLIWWAYLFV